MDESHAVYRICAEGGREPISARRFEHELASVTRTDATAGGLRCAEGHPMCFVSKSCWGRVCHFRHIPESKKRKSDEWRPDNVYACSASNVHVHAQSLIRENCHRLAFKAFRDCGKCTSTVFGPARQATAKLEVSMHAEGTEDGKLIRADVCIYIKDRLMLTVEVRHTHRTDPASRGDVPFVEVDAEHVVRTITNSLDTKDTIVLNCEGTNMKKWCTASCDDYDSLYYDYVEELYEIPHDNRSGSVPFKGKSLCALCRFGTIQGSYSHCYVCYMALKDKGKGTKKADSLLSERWKTMKRMGLVYVSRDDDAKMCVKGLDGGYILELN